jgi:pimeloyl-ACP methyl ester carboxylesterase
MATLNHRVAGTGPAVLLLHAGVTDLQMWDTQVAALSGDHTVIRCDLRGFGGSALEPGAAYSDPEDVLALLDDLGVEQLAVVAASYGGYVALQLATAAPHRVERLVLLDPLAEVAEPDDALRGLWREENALVEAGDLDGATELNVRRWVGPDADDAARDLVRRTQRAALVAQVAAGDEVDNQELPVDLDALTMPVRLFVGAHDFAFFVETARELTRRLPDARLVELDWAGHLPSLERPEETAGLVRDAMTR